MKHLLNFHSNNSEFQSFKGFRHLPENKMFEIKGKSSIIPSYSKSVINLHERWENSENKKIMQKAFFERIDIPLGDDCDNLDSIKNSFVNNTDSPNETIKDSIPSEGGDEDVRYQINKNRLLIRIFPKLLSTKRQSRNRIIENNLILTIPGKQATPKISKSIQELDESREEFKIHASPITVRQFPTFAKNRHLPKLKNVEKTRKINKFTLNKKIDVVNNIQLFQGKTSKKILNIQTIDFWDKKDKNKNMTPKLNKLNNKNSSKIIPNVQTSYDLINCPRIEKSTSFKSNIKIQKNYQYKSSINDIIYPSLQSKFKFSPTFYSPKKSLKSKLDANLYLALTVAAQSRSVKNGLYLSESMRNTVCASQCIELGANKLNSEPDFTCQKEYQI